MYSLLKSQVGSWPEPTFPRGIELELEASRSRRRIYPVTVIYCVLLLALLTQEWAHHAMHFRNCGWRHFQHVRRRHLYHHSRYGVGTAYGITSEFWDKVLGTRIPAPQRDRLLPRLGARSSAPLHA